MRVLAEQGIRQGGVQMKPHILKNCEYTLCNLGLLELKQCLCQVQFSLMTRLTFCLLLSLAKLSSQFYFFLIAHINFSLLGFHNQILCSKHYRSVLFFPQVFDSVIKKGGGKGNRIGFYWQLV